MLTHSISNIQSRLLLYLKFSLRLFALRQGSRWSPEDVLSLLVIFFWWALWELFACIISDYNVNRVQNFLILTLGVIFTSNIFSKELLRQTVGPFLTHILWDIDNMWKRCCSGPKGIMSYTCRKTPLFSLPCSLFEMTSQPESESE